MSWPLVKLGEVAKLINGDRGKNYPSKGSFVDKGIPFINAGCLSNEHTLIDEELNFITEEKFDSLRSGKIEKGDILFCLRGSLGKFALVDTNMKGAIASSLVIIRANEKVYIDYLKHYLGSFLCQREIQAYENGAAQPNLSATDLKSFQIPLPPLEAQKRIAAILDKADAIRQKRKQAIELADEFLRSVFLDMFGDPVTNPKGWEVRTFGELGCWASGGTPSRSNPSYFEGAINWYSARELNERYLNGSIEKITNDALNESAAKMFPSGSMLVGMYDTAALKISILKEASASNQACANIIPNELVDIEWLYSYIDFFKDIYLRQRRGVRQKNLNLGMMKEFELPLPPKNIQLEFVNVAKTLMQVKANKSKFCREASNCFNSLSQKAFSGEL